MVIRPVIHPCVSSLPAYMPRNLPQLKPSGASAVAVMPSIDQCATTANRSAPTMDSHEKEQPVPIWPSGLLLRL